MTMPSGRFDIPAVHHQTDVLIIGGGAAGTMAAFECAEAGVTVIQVTKGRATTNDQHVGLVVHGRNIEVAKFARHGHLRRLGCRWVTSCAISKNASTQASANAVSFTCSGSSLTRTDFRCDLRVSTKIW